MGDTIPLWSLIGGMVLGLSAILLLFISGKVAGISGIINGLLFPTKGDVLWRALFLLGLVIGGTIGLVSMGIQAPDTDGVPIHILILAGLLVGFGTRLGNGCTSGHGICGVGRLSVRSLLATGVFIFSAMVTVWLTHEVGL
ncbi:YeeE/YedE family protein [Vibrio pectenicida]|uniref:YeeE/YedE family protein n=1 Tax=Vibrio pectenicida TaxID=62763 RepID=A0A7Y3ZYH1_9VIBR|nr:YeeE/YedE thiosulfate transporter family protein [Vibrio pectenicida]NOH71248.1 YeeE/YedE family protein [Vibrio pectenicida]